MRMCVRAVFVASLLLLSIDFATASQCNHTLYPGGHFTDTISGWLDSHNNSLPVVICVAGNGTHTGCSTAPLTTLGGGPVTIVGLSFEGRKPLIDCANNGRLFSAPSGNARLENLEIVNGNPSGTGVIYISGSTNLELLSVDAHRNQDAFIYTRDSSAITIDTCNFTDHDRGFVDPKYGGVMYQFSSGTSYIYDSWFTHNTAYIGGAFMKRAGGTLYVYNTTFAENKSLDGAVASVNGGRVRVYDSVGVANVGSWGSFAHCQSKLEIYNTLITEEVSGTATITHYFNGADVTVSGCTFKSNNIRATYSYGSGTTTVVSDSLFVDSGGSPQIYGGSDHRITITGSVFSGCTGAMSTSGSTSIYYYNNTFKDGVSWGTAVSASSSTSVTVDSSVFLNSGRMLSSNSAVVTVSNCVVKDLVQGDTIYVSGSSADVTADGLTIINPNNRVFYNFGGQLTITNTVVNGGSGSDFLYAYGADSTSTLDGVVVKGFRVTRAVVYLYYGGVVDALDFVYEPDGVMRAAFAASFYNSGVVNLHNPVLSSYNTTVPILEAVAGRIFVYGGTIDSVHTEAGGAVAAATNGGVVSVVDSLIGNVTTANGGWSLYALSDSTLRLERTSVSNVSGNTFGDGGAVYAADSAVELIDCLLSNTTTSGSGGFAFLDGSSSLRVADSVVSGCSAGGQGGAFIGLDGTDFNITDTVVSGNVADSGGALFFSGNQLAMAGSTFSSNTGLSNVGGVFVFLPRVAASLRRCIFEQNSGAQLSVFAVRELELTSCGVVARPGEVGVDLLSVANALLTNCSVWSEGNGEALRATASQYVSLTGSLVGGDSPGGTPSLFCTASTLNVEGGVTCFNGGAGAQCSACTLTGDVSVCSDLYSGGSCVDTCEAANWCVPDSLLSSTAPNAGCPSCDGACFLETDACDDLSTNCFDTRSGGFTCACETGFESLANNSCTDIDECSLGTDNCAGAAVCTNTPGSFTCDCPAGYIQDGPLNCLDVDECDPNPCGAEFACVNSVGSFECICGPDYYVYGNSSECRLCDDGWLTLNNEYCVGECPTGYLTWNNTECLDINECDSSPCGEGTKCVNTAGSYSCGKCKSGYYRYNSSSECRPCSQGWYVLSGTACVECAAGKYTDVVNSPSCSACAPYSTSGPGASSCYCSPGYVDIGAGCVANCTIGQYAYTATLCLNCPKGSYGSAAGVCDSCPPFTTTASTGHVGLDSCECVAGDLVPSPTDFAGSGCVPSCGPGRYADVDDGVCLSCPSNTYKDTTGLAANCTVCPVSGMYTEGTGSTNLTDCMCGEGQQIESVAGSLSCTTHCAPGLSRPSPWEECEVCGSSTYSAEPNSKVCSICPANTFAPPQSTSVSACLCRKGFYSPSKMAGKSCVPCPEGAECTGGLADPVSREGFAPVGEEFIACTPSSACIGKGECSVGYSGERCATCSPGYHRSSGYCQPCGAATLIAVILGVLCAMVMVTGLVVFNMSEGSSQRLRSTVITLNAVQIIAQFGRLQIGWPLYVQRMFDVLGAFNLNVELVAPECAVGTSNPFVIRFVAAMVMPLLLAAVLGGGYMIFLFVSLVRPVTKVVAYNVRRSVLLCGLQLVLILYLPLSVATFEFFDCVPAGSKSVLASSPEVECGSGVWQKLLPLAAICVVLYPVAVPLVLTGSLAYGRYFYGAEDFVLRFGYLTNRYAPEHYYYELVVMVRKLVVAVTLTFVTASPYIQAGATVIWILFNFLIHHIAKPYATDFLNLVESGALFSVLLIIQEGVMFQDDLLTPAVKATIILFTLFCFFGFAGCAITYEYRGVLAEGSTLNRRGTHLAGVFESTRRESHVGSIGRGGDSGDLDSTGDTGSVEWVGMTMSAVHEETFASAGSWDSLSMGVAADSVYANASASRVSYGGGGEAPLRPSVLPSIEEGSGSVGTTDGSGVDSSHTLLPLPQSAPAVGRGHLAGSGGSLQRRGTAGATASAGSGALSALQPSVMADSDGYELGSDDDSGDGDLAVRRASVAAVGAPSILYEESEPVTFDVTWTVNADDDVDDGADDGLCTLGGATSVYGTAHSAAATATTASANASVGSNTSDTAPPPLPRRRQSVGNPAVVELPSVMATQYSPDVE